MQTSVRLALLLLLSSAAPLLAQEEEPGLLELNSGLMVWTVLIFLIVLAVLWKFAYPHILGAVEAREQRIRELAASAARDRAEAEALLAENRQHLEETRARTQEILAESRAAGERMRDEMLAETRRQQEDLLLRARQDIQRETDRALDTVRREAVELALAAAEKVIGRNLSTEDNYRLVQQALGQMPSVGSARVPAGV